MSPYRDRIHRDLRPVTTPSDDFPEARSAPERGEVEVAPRANHRLVAAIVDEVRAEDPVAVADEGIRAVPFADSEVRVEVVW
jgi:hypothetical protein